MVRKIKNTGNNNVPEIVVTLVEEQGQDYEKSTSQNSKNNKTHKKKKSREQEQIKRNNLPKIIITDLSDDVQDKSLTNSNSNKKSLPKNIINIEDNEITSTNSDFVDFDYANQSISNESSNIKQQKKEPITNNINNPSSKNFKSNQLWKFLKRKFLVKGYDLRTIS